MKLLSDKILVSADTHQTWIINHTNIDISSKIQIEFDCNQQPYQIVLISQLVDTILQKTKQPESTKTFSCFKMANSNTKQRIPPIQMPLPTLPRISVPNECNIIHHQPIQSPHSKQLQYFHLNPLSFSQSGH